MGMKTTTTNLGYQVKNVHDLAALGYKYRTQEISDFVHVDEYVAPCGVWVYLGWLKGVSK